LLSYTGARRTPLGIANSPLAKVHMNAFEVMFPKLYLKHFVYRLRVVTKTLVLYLFFFSSCITLAVTSEDEEHLSHPIHSDNCIVNGDGPGTCPERNPAYTWRDYR